MCDCRAHRMCHEMAQVVADDNQINAFHHVTKGDSGPGIDGVRPRDLRDYISVHGDALYDEILTGQYQPLPLKPVVVEKFDGKGGQRELHIPTVIDRFVQRLILPVVRAAVPVSENVHGSLARRSAWDHIKSIQAGIMGGGRHIVRVDVKDAYPSVDQALLLGRLAKVVRCKNLRAVIRHIMRTPVQRDLGTALPTTSGIAQGGPLSPVLLHLLLQDVDKVLRRARSVWTRYTDEIVVCTGSARTAQRAFSRVSKALGAVGLDSHPEKSGVMPASSLEFLGVEFEENGRTRVSRLARERFLCRLKAAHAHEFYPARLERALADKCRGYRNYYQQADDYDHHARDLMEDLERVVKEGEMSPGIRWIGPIHLMNRARS